MSTSVTVCKVRPTKFTGKIPYLVSLCTRQTRIAETFRHDVHARQMIRSSGITVQEQGGIDLLGARL